LPGAVGEELGDEERLRQESLNLARSVHHQTVLFGQLIQAKDGDDILQLVIPLQLCLDSLGSVVVLFTYDPGLKHRGS
jgi:hypothetical protein